MQKKGQTKNSVSAVVFTNSVPNFWGWATKMLFFAESPIKIGVWAYFEKGRKGQKCEKGWAEHLCNYVTQHNWTDFQLNKMFFCLFSFFYFYENRILPAERRLFLKNKKENGKFGQIFNSRKGNVWTDFQLYSIYIYIHTVPAYVRLILILCCRIIIDIGLR